MSVAIAITVLASQQSEPMTGAFGASWLAIGTAIVLLGATLTVVSKWGIRPLWTLFKGTSQFIEDWNGHPARPGVQAQAGIMQTLYDTGQRLAAVEQQTRQLETNGGGHMRDDIAAIKVTVDNYVAEWAEQQTALRAEIVLEEAKVREALDTQAAKVSATLDRQESSVLNTLDEQENRVRERLSEQENRVRETLEAQERSVATKLELHTNEVDAEFKDVWKALATRDIHKSSDQLLAAAERAEQAQRLIDPIL